MSCSIYLETEYQNKLAENFSPCSMVNFPHTVIQFDTIFFCSSSACVVDFPTILLLKSSLEALVLDCSYIPVIRSMRLCEIGDQVSFFSFLSVHTQCIK